MKVDDKVPNAIGLTDREMIFAFISLAIAGVFLVLGILSTLKTFGL